MKQNEKNDQLKKLVKDLFFERTASGSMQGTYKVTVGWPAYDEKEILQALDSLLDLRISQGPKVKMFEGLCARYIGTNYAVAVNSGSSANLLALSAFIERGDMQVGDEVIIPASTFATVASPIIQLGLVPVYVDVDPVSWNIDANLLEDACTEKTKILMPVHTFGNPADMNKIMDIAKRRNLLVLEDCCEAHGASLDGRKVGSFGNMATLSFFVAHNITTGEGGMIFTNDRDYYEILISLREFGRLQDDFVRTNRFGYEDEVMEGYDARYIFTRLGYNVRMTDVEAALGIEQIKKLDSLNSLRIDVVNKYNKAFVKYTDYIQLPSVKKEAFHSFYGYPFMIKPGAPFSRAELVDFLETKQIETRPFFAGCLPDQPGFRNTTKRIAGDLHVSRYIRDNALFIGCHPMLSEELVDYVINVFAEFFSKFGL